MSYTMTLQNYSHLLPYDYLIRQNGANYEAIDGYTGVTEYTNATLATVEQYCLTNLTAGVIIAKEVAWDTSLVIPQNIRVIEDVNGVETEYSAIIFRNGFEHGSFYGWSHYGIGTNAPTITSDAYAGMYGAICPDLYYAVAKWDLECPRTVYVNGWFKFSAMPGAGNSLQFLNGYETGYTAPPEHLCFYTYLFNNDPYGYNLVCSDTASAWNSANIGDISGDYHYFQIKYVQSSTAEAADGALQVWLDYESVISVTGQVYPYALNILKVGAYDGTEENVDVTVDSVVVSNYWYAGPYV